MAPSQKNISCIVESAPPTQITTGVFCCFFSLLDSEGTRSRAGMSTLTPDEGSVKAITRFRTLMSIYAVAWSKASALLFWSSAHPMGRSSLRLRLACTVQHGSSCRRAAESRCRWPGGRDPSEWPLALSSWRIQLNGTKRCTLEPTLALVSSPHRLPVGTPRRHILQRVRCREGV